MSDNDIIKAIDCLRGEKIYCKECACREAEYPKCKRDAAENTLALINRQKAEIEALKVINSTYVATTEEIREIAIKEFAERLKADAMPAEIGKYTYRITTTEGIDYLVKEMVGERSEK